MSVEFPYTALPATAWERDLAKLKEMGVSHVSLPQSPNTAQLDEVIRIVRSLGIEANIEGPRPSRLQALAKSHGGPLTDELTGAVRISATMPRALDNERKLLTSGTPAIVWTDVFETLSPAYQPGAIKLGGGETAAAAVIRREARLARYWGLTLATLPEAAGARLAIPVEGLSVHQYIADKSGTPNLSLASVTNDTQDPWVGEVRVMYPFLQRPIGLPAVTVAAHDMLWLPVNIPLTAGVLCSGCTGFAPSDHLAYATAELTAMEYENGILAMEFISFSPGEAVLQLSHEPVGPLIGGGKPSVFDWDPKTQRARLTIPAGNKTTGHVRVALAIDAPPATAFFDSASVLLIGETNKLTAHFSPAAVASRSRLRIVPELTATQEVAPPEIDPDKVKTDKPAVVSYRVNVPAGVVADDTAQVAIEADGMQLSHLQLRIVPPAAVTFEDAVTVRVAASSSVPLTPPTIPVNQRSGRDIVLSLRNNAPEIRTFELTLTAPGLEFSPAKLNVSVGASVARELIFRIFSSKASPGIHEGTVTLSGAAVLSEPIRFVVLPPSGGIAWSAGAFSMLESVKSRASFLAGRWLEMINKDSGADMQPAGGTAFTGGRIESLKMEDLEKMLPSKP
jgi:hypothetical protein